MTRNAASPLHAPEFGVSVSKFPPLPFPPLFLALRPISLSAGGRSNEFVQQSPTIVPGRIFLIPSTGGKLDPRIGISLEPRNQSSLLP